MCGPLDTQPTVLLVIAQINAFDFSSTLRPDNASSSEEYSDYSFLLTDAERIQVKLYIDFTRYRAAVESTHV